MSPVVAATAAPVPSLPLLQPPTVPTWGQRSASTAASLSGSYWMPASSTVQGTLASKIFSCAWQPITAFPCCGMSCGLSHGCLLIPRPLPPSAAGHAVLRMTSVLPPCRMVRLRLAPPSLASMPSLTAGHGGIYPESIMLCSQCGSLPISISSLGMSGVRVLSSIAST